MQIHVNDRVYIKEQKRPFRVKACNERYAICTKPCNLHHTVIYFILDIEKLERGPDNMIFCFGYETKEQCEERLKELTNGQISISQRRKICFNTITQIGNNIYLYYKN